MFIVKQPPWFSTGKSASLYWNNPYIIFDNNQRLESLHLTFHDPLTLARCYFFHVLGEVSCGHLWGLGQADGWRAGCKLAVHAHMHKRVCTNTAEWCTLSAGWGMVSMMWVHWSEAHGTILQMVYKPIIQIFEKCIFHSCMKNSDTSRS